MWPDIRCSLGFGWFEWGDTLRCPVTSVSVLVENDLSLGVWILLFWLCRTTFSNFLGVYLLLLCLMRNQNIVSDDAALFFPKLILLDLQYYISDVCVLELD
jgi:hypothetical protein